MIEWFKDWFETDDYLEIYKHRGECEANQLLSLVLNNIDIRNDASVLDIACGTGRHSLLFAKKGFSVFSFDLSKNQLRIAKNKSSEQNAEVNYFCADVRYLPLKKKFDLILNLFTSFGYFENDEENFALLEDAYNYLNTNGSFVLDYFNLEYLSKNLEPKSVDLINGKVVLQERYFEGNRINKNITIKNSNEIKTYLESVRHYTKDEILNSMKKLGFKILKIYGDYSGDCFNKDSSPRLIIFASK